MSLLTLFASTTGTLGAPDVSVLSATNIMAFTASLRGRIDNNHGYNVTDIGFEWGTVSGLYDQSYNETINAPYTGIITNAISGLNEFDTYYFRFWATNSAGTTYTPEIQFTTIATTYAVAINSVNRTADVLSQSLTIEDVINDEQNTCTFSLIDRSGNGLPSTDQEIIITDLDGNKIFGGYITKLSMSKLSSGVVLATCECVDYSRLLDGYLVHDNYQSMLDSDIIKTIINDYAGATGITTNNVLDGATIDKITFNYQQPSQVFRRIAELTSRYWYIDYDKDINYFPLTTNTTPFNIDSSSANYTGLQIASDATQVKNRVYVRGGTKLSDFTTYSTIGDGEAIAFVLPDKPHSVTVTVNAVSKTVGIKNVNTSGYDWYLNYQEKYIEQDSGGVVLTSSDVLAVTYKYDIPILIALEDNTSIEAIGAKEFAIFDSSISTTDEARARASAELTDYANNLISGTFITRTSGFRSGQYININLSDYGVNDDYIVQKVNTTSLGAGLYEYSVTVASAKTLGIIRFLIDLLEADKNLVNVSDDEVVDELYNLADTATATDNLNDAVHSSTYVWSNDAGTTPDKMVWDLFEWS